MPASTPYDLRLFVRTLGLAVLALAIVALVEGVTDERGIAAPGTGGRSIGLLPLTPIAGAIAVLIALAPAVSSGELRALAALGASPLRARLAPIACAVSLAILSAVAVAAGATDVTALFPPPTQAGDYRVEPGPSFVSLRRRVRIDENDVLDRISAPAAVDEVLARSRRSQSLAAALTIALAGAALALFIGSPLRRRPMRTLVTFSLYGAAQVAAFQSAGAGAIPAIAAALPPIALSSLALLEYRSTARLPREESWI